MMEYPEELEPNMFYEPRPAVAPFYVLKNGLYPSIRGPFETRGEAEESAREAANKHWSESYFVVGCVSISSVPKPIPLKASTRALV